MYSSETFEAFKIAMFACLVYIDAHPIRIVYLIGVRIFSSTWKHDITKYLNNKLCHRSALVVILILDLHSFNTSLLKFYMVQPPRPPCVFLYL